jgi:hypothetical protein
VKYRLVDWSAYGTSSGSKYVSVYIKPWWSPFYFPIYSGTKNMHNTLAEAEAYAAKMVPSWRLPSPIKKRKVYKEGDL